MKVISLDSRILPKAEPTYLKYSLSQTIGKNLSDIDDLPESVDFASEVAKIKNTGSAIKSLEKMTKEINDLKTQNSELSKINDEIQKQEDPTSQEFTELYAKANEIKAKMQQTFDSAMLNDENVFSKNYQNFSSNIEVNGNRLAPHSMEISNQAIKAYTQALDEEKAYAKQAKEILEKNIDDSLDKIQNATSSFKKLYALPNDDIKTSRYSGLTFDKILNIFG